MKDELLEWESREYLQAQVRFHPGFDIGFEPPKVPRILPADPPKRPISIIACCIWLGVCALWVTAIAVWLWRTA